MNNKAIIAAVVAGITIALPYGSLGDGLPDARVKVNGRFVDSEAKIINDRVYLPVRAVGEALGADVMWNEQERTAEINLSSAGSVAAIVKEVSPSVVGIIGIYKDSKDYVDEKKYEEHVIHGTGVIIQENGVILTNAHVVKDMEQIVAVLSDGSGYTAKIQCMDANTDLAVIKIEKGGLQAAQFGTEDDLVIGRTVIAIGTPVSFSLRNSASTGIISGIDRSLDSDYRLIQTDAAINPGNSGGPLISLDGKVIGINSSKFVSTGVEGLGFSIPISTIKYVLKHYQQYGKVNRPDLGVDFEEDWIARYGLSGDAGLKVVGYADSKSPQDLKAEDVLLAVSDRKVHSMVDFYELMKEYIPGDNVILKIKRDGVIQSIATKLVQQKESEED